MKAITYDAYGTSENLKLVDVSPPKVGPGEVLVRVKAAGVNPVDWKLAAGYLDPILEVRHPVIPGWDVAGVVEAVGPDTFDFALGDEVYGYVRKEWVELGTYAELVSAPVRTLARKPRALTFEQAAGIPLAGLTAYQSLTRAGLKAGETVVIHSAAGGTGSFGVQIAVALGLRVIGTAGAHNPTHTCARSAPSPSCTGRASRTGSAPSPPKASTPGWTSTGTAPSRCSSPSSRTAPGWSPSPITRPPPRAPTSCGCARTPPT